MMVHCILIALVSFSINFSLCDLFSKKDRYKINTTQELLAYGSTNVFASFFPCFSTGASLARSCLQYNAGGKTQLVSIVSSLILAMVLMFIAPLFRELPQACLASMIVVSLKTLFANLLQLPFYWKVNKIEFVSQFLFRYNYSNKTNFLNFSSSIISVPVFADILMRSYS
jgi:solute carrier family 26 protein